jgi:hypothetical protein
MRRTHRMRLTDRIARITLLAKNIPSHLHKYKKPPSGGFFCLRNNGIKDLVTHDLREHNDRRVRR